MATEAIHHKTLAESSFNSGDLMSALIHARKALGLSPDSEGLSAMVTAFEIISSAAATAGGMPEWYKVLKVEPFSHINTIKQQYRKLALVLHPDKNPYAGCEEGFKLLNEALSVFSDKVRRTEYDMKLRIRIQSEMVSGCDDDDDDETSTFSTVCSGCRSVHKFGRKYLGQNLMCTSCKNSFEAKEAEKEEEGRDGSETGTCASKIITYSRRKKRAGDDSESLRSGSETGEMREERAEAIDVSDGLDDEDEGMMTLAEMQSVIRRKKSKVKSNITEKDSTAEENMGSETEERSSGDVPMTITLREMSSNKENEKREALKNGKNINKKKATNHKVLNEIVDLEYVPRGDRKREHGKLSQEIYREDEDLELYDFGKDRMPRSFKKGQIWAIYDGGDDNMPRSYCLVSEVVSLNPFKVWINWLDCESEKLISWMKISSSNMPCGRFRVSEKALVEQVKPFSHIVNCERAAREVYQIYPRKGSVWAVYSETNPALQRRKTGRYEIVVCLTMYSEAYGLSVAYLEKVNDCSSNLFKRRDYGYNAVRWVEKDDVAALLSHQIPAKKVSEHESGADLKESWVLDLASVPPDLVSAP
ncbi:PREDICTED: dnaJ homolog subfamily C member 21-like [Camelina sativa]|uniref:DnaJ homolog subfamily C member 21-like n=1 Tax=Camelina sativa TaxID=90675 RepID=A0ABM0Z2R1_CAMSA|nr:PREDICTED: dnaJ homolog subfamily C member 21-like [Camelina sativa]